MYEVEVEPTLDGFTEQQWIDLAAKSGVTMTMTTMGPNGYQLFDATAPTRKQLFNFLYNHYCGQDLEETLYVMSMVTIQEESNDRAGKL